MLALITPVMTSTDGRCVAITRWMPDGARHLRDAADARLDVARSHHHQVVELVDDDEDVRQALVALPRHRVGVVGRREVAAVEQPSCSR